RRSTRTHFRAERGQCSSSQNRGSGVSHPNIRRSWVRSKSFAQTTAALTVAGSSRPGTRSETSSAEGLMSDLVKDLVYGARMLLKSPGFTAIAVLTLALGIGANTALYGVANELLKSIAGVSHPEELIDVVGMRTGEEGGYGLLPYADYFDYGAADDVFALSAVKGTSLKVTWKTDSALVLAEIVSGNYFDMLGVRPILGRTFSGDEAAGSVGPPVTVLGYTSWQNRFGGATDIVGQTVKLNGQPFTIIGVTPKGFVGRGRQVV